MGAIITRASGFAVDAGQALWERVGVVINTFLTWVEQTNAKMVDGQTGPDVSLLKDLDKALKDRALPAYCSPTSRRSRATRSSTNTSRRVLPCRTFGCTPTRGTGS